MLQLSICIPLLALLGIIAAGRYPNLREAVSLCASFSVFYLVFNLYKGFRNGEIASVLWLEIFPGLAVSFGTDSLGLIFALVASFLWLITTVYAIGYMRAHNETHQTRFFAYFSVAMASAMAIAFASNLFTLFIFYEILTLSTYPLVTHAGTGEAKKSGRIYLGILLGTSILFFLLAIISTFLITGTLDFTEGGIFSDDISPVVTGTLLVLFIIGIGKAAVMPFHGWLPAAMVAPVPVSALLHAVAVVKAGVFSIMKVCLLIFGFDLLNILPATQGLLYLAGASVLIASLMALRQDNLKARLAYSTISQLSYITIGALLATGSAIVGSSLHIAMHAFGKITLFFCAGAIMVSAHKTEISQMRGLGRQMPITMIAFFIGSLCIIGVPPTGGTWSKWYLISGTFQAEQWILTGTLIFSSLLSIAYLLPISIRAFFPVEDSPGIRLNFREAPLPSLLALTITAAGCVLLFFFPQPLYELAAALIP
jgi:multicomponent Na+:H+ antiporter subunit D